MDTSAEMMVKWKIGIIIFIVILGESYILPNFLHKF